ncbi:MAG: copper resistance protein CopC [Bryocella sp.]
MKNLIILFAVSLLSAHAYAQGCSQCLDSTQATPPAMQAAYRHAILLLASAAATLFGAMLVIIYRNR